MSFCLYALAMDKNIQNKARQEVLKVLGDEPEDVLPTMEDLRQITYLDMVIKEVSFYHYYLLLLLSKLFFFI
jgi:hypothetical protein